MTVTISEGERPRDAAFWEATYHTRVDRLLLPLSVRQNRIEDIFADFLVELVALARGNRIAPRDTKDRFKALRDALEGGVDNVDLPTSDAKAELVFRWLRAELVREGRASNRRQTDAENHSIIPLHLAVAERFGPPAGNLPSYGKLLCEMLSTGRPASQETTLLRRLWEFFGRSDGDPLAAILELAFSRRESGEPQGTSWAYSKPGFVRCPEHARRFQRDVENVLRFKVSRRTMLLWLYSLFAFYLATYFLRMAHAAERCAKALTSTMNGTGMPYVLCERCGLAPAASTCTGLCSNAVDIVLGERNYDHARLLKRYPYYTSQLQVVRSYPGLEQLDGLDPGAALAALFGFLVDEVARNCDQVAEWFEYLANLYPTESDNQRRRDGGRESKKWRLSQADKERAIKLYKQGQASAFETVALHLNFEDMARASNNVMEWQFYQTLARDPVYGFALGRGEELRYTLPEGLLTALVHAHIAETGEDATVQSFEDDMREAGLCVDDTYRADLVRSLVNFGLVEDVADAGDAKQLLPLYQLEESR